MSETKEKVCEELTELENLSLKVLKKKLNGFEQKLSALRMMKITKVKPLREEPSPKVEVQFEKPSEPELKKAEEMFKPFVEATTKLEYRSIYENEEAALMQWLKDIQEKKKAEFKLYSLIEPLSQTEKEVLSLILNKQLEDSNISNVNQM